MARNNSQPNVKKTYLTDKSKRSLIHRLNRVEGHIRAIRKMIEEGRCCDDLLIQVAATKAAMTQVAVKLLEEHFFDCVNTCMEGSEEEVLERITRALSTILKQS